MRHGVLGRLLSSGVLEKILVGEGVRVQPGSVVAHLSQSDVPQPQSPSSAQSDAEASSNPTQMPPGTVSIFMPALSSTMTSGVVSAWLKSEGDKVQVRKVSPRPVPCDGAAAALLRVRRRSVRRRALLAGGRPRVGGGE